MLFSPNQLKCVADTYQILNEIDPNYASSDALVDINIVDDVITVQQVVDPKQKYLRSSSNEFDSEDTSNTDYTTKSDALDRMARHLIVTSLPKEWPFPTTKSPIQATVQVGFASIDIPVSMADSYIDRGLSVQFTYKDGSVFVASPYK